MKSSVSSFNGTKIGYFTLPLFIVATFGQIVYLLRVNATIITMFLSSLFAGLVTIYASRCSGSFFDIFRVVYKEIDACAIIAPSGV